MDTMLADRLTAPQSVLPLLFEWRGIDIETGCGFALLRNCLQGFNIQFC